MIRSSILAAVFLVYTAMVSVLDQAFGVGRVLGVTGTPSAVAVGEHGRVASKVVVSAHAVLELIRATPARAGVGA